MKYRHRLGIFVSAFLALITVILVWPALVGRLPGHRLPPTTVIEPSSMSSPQTIQIRLGEQPTDFLARFADRVKVNSQPAGLDFLSIDWRHPRMARSGWINPMPRLQLLMFLACRPSGVLPRVLSKALRASPSMQP